MKKERKFVRRSLAVFFILMMMCVVWGCSGEKGYSVNEEDFMTALLKEVTFACDLSQVKEEGVKNFLSFEEEPEALMYMGSGSFADCAAIFTAADEEGAGKVLKSVEAYREDLKRSFEDYIPEEVSKIEDGVAEQKGKYVVLCITGDADRAREFIDEYFDQHQGGETGEEAVDPEKEDEEKGEAEQEADPQDTQQSAVSYPKIEQKGEVIDYGNVIAVGDAAYELYSYVEGTAEKYAQIVNRTADNLKGKTAVYDLLIPLSSGITLPDPLYGKISSSGQKTALDKISALMNDNVSVINPYDNLMKHRDEYIYFRTDHHWTADGAYYAYEDLCKAAGLEAIPREKHKTDTFDGFLGSFYKDTNQNEQLGANPDSIKVYYPVSEDTSLVYTNTNGNSNSWKVIWDVSDYSASMKYSTFIAGDNPFTKIENADLNDGSACIIVKESFGNAMVPFLVDHYQTVYVVDYRYWQGSLTELAKETGARDLYFFNNLSMIRSDYLVGKLSQIA